MTIVVTGATGTVGREVIRYFLAEKQPCIAAVRNIQKANTLFSAKCPLRLLDYNNPMTYAGAVLPQEKVFLIPPSSSKEYPAFLSFLDYLETLHLLSVIVLTGLGAEQEAGVGLWEVEEKLKSLAFKKTILRPNWFMQNFSTYWKQDISLNQSITLPAGEGRTSFIDVRDIGPITKVLFTEKGPFAPSYILTGPQALTYGDIAETLSRVLKKTIRYTAISDDEAAALWQEQGWSLQSVRDLQHHFQRIRSGETAIVSPAIPTLIHRPATTFAQFVKDYEQSWH